MAVAFRAGVGLKDMEMIQFHPTGLGKTGILMSEAVRGEGGYLLNVEGERFMKKYAPNKMELASRDVVAKAIEDEIAAGRGFNGSGLDAYVVADLRHLGPEVIIEKLHGIRDLALCFEPLKPRPAAISSSIAFATTSRDANSILLGSVFFHETFALNV